MGESVTARFAVGKRGAAVALAFAVAASGAACGGDPFEEATRELEAAAEAVEVKRTAVEERSAALDAARKKLAEAEEKLRAAEARLQQAEKQMGKHARDPVALQRAVQKRLLEEDDLESVALVAQVSEGVVTLTGSVPKPEIRDRAIEIVRSVPGVVSVHSRIQVTEPAAPKS